MSALTSGFGYSSALDVGTGTGRGVKHFLDHHPGLEVKGVEPVRAMIDQAEQRNGVPEGTIVEARGDELPFDDDTFDLVCELGVLHHVAEPAAVVDEMIRVARRAIFLSDSNRFANGGPLRRAVKYGLYRLGGWSAAFRMANGGKDYLESDGDGGVAYSYSVYDSLPQLHDWADRVFFVPTGESRPGWFHPLFGAHNLLLCALRDD